MASRGESTFAVNIVGNVKGLEKDLKAAGLWTDELRGKIDALNQHQINLKGERALAQLNSIGGTAETTGTKLRAVFTGQAQSAVDGFASRLGPAGEALKAIGPGAIAAGAGVAVLGIAVSKSIQEFTSLASSVATFKRITGATAEDSSRLVALLDDVGISAETGARAFAQLAKNVDSKAFANANIDIAKTKSGATDLSATFLNVSKRLEGIKDPAERANVLIAAFGKQGEALGPIFDRGTEAIQRMMKANEGQVLSDEDLRNAREFRDAMDQLADVAKEAELALAKVVIPQATDTINAANTLIDALKKVGSVKVGDKSVLGMLWDSINPLSGATSAIKGIGEQWDYWFNDNKNAKAKKAAEAAKEAADAQEQVASATAKANEAAAAGLQAKADALRLEEKISSAKKAVADAQAHVNEVEQAGAEKIAAAKQKIVDLESKRVDLAKAVTKAQETLTSASQKLVDVQQRENDAYFRWLQVMGRAQVDVKELADAQRDLADAQREVTDLAEREADARRSLADAQKALARDVVRLPAQAEKDVAAARRDQVRATERLADLEAKRSDTTLTSRERADLELDIADARDAVTEASWRVADAEQALADVHDTLQRKAADVVSKEQDLVDIHDQQSKAAQGVVDAEGKLVEVRDGAQPGSARAIEAEKNLKDARDATKTATEQVTTAEENLTKALEAQKELPGKIKDAETELVKVQQQAAKDRIAAIESVNTALGNQKQLLLDIQIEAAKAGTSIPQSLDAAMPTTSGRVYGPPAPAGTPKVGKYSAEALSNIATVARIAKEHGYSDSQIAGILGNVSVETGGSFSNSAYNPKEDAVGLFQERTSYGSRADRQDPVKATKMILAEARRMGVLPNDTQDAGDFAALFDKKVERSDGKARAERMRRAEQLLNDPQIQAILKRAGGNDIQKMTSGALDELPTLEDAGIHAGQALVDGMERAITAGVDIVGAAAKALSDKNAAALEAAGQASVKTAKATVLTLSQLYAEFAKTSNIGQAAAGLSQAPARYVGGQNADGSNIIVHAFAANPVYGGTLFDKNGQQVYADDAAGIREALDPSNPYLTAPPSIEQMGRATPRGGIQNFATGGIVTSETFARIGEAGPEAVIPLSSGMASGLLGGPTVNVYVSGSVISERDLVDKIRKELLVAQSRGQTLVF